MDIPSNLDGHNTMITLASFTIPSSTYVWTMIDDIYPMITHFPIHFGPENISAGVSISFRFMCFYLRFFGVALKHLQGQALGVANRYPGFCIGWLVVCCLFFVYLCLIPCIGFAVGCQIPVLCLCFHNTLYPYSYSSPHFGANTLTLHTYERGRKKRQRDS
ncbi:hypothetical protein F4818DRAFT_368699 [Hypoxylon cercidicola]|nr:hypothetical protein F4818DRAFT_368699 [Hypoxylon cercidicola]